MVNKVILLGNLGHDPEVNYTGNGKAVCNFSMATTMKSKDKEYTEWHKVVVWGAMAEPCGEYLFKGSTVYVEGRIQSGKYTDKEGVEKYKTEIIADKVQFLSKPKKDDELF